MPGSVTRTFMDGMDFLHGMSLLLTINHSQLSSVIQRDWYYAPRNEEDRRLRDEWLKGEAIQKIWEFVSKESYWDDVEVSA